MNDDFEARVEAAARESERQGRKPDVGEERTIWVQGRFDIRCTSHRKDGSIGVLLLPSGHVGVARNDDGGVWEYRRLCD